MSWSGVGVARCWGGEVARWRGGEVVGSCGVWLNSPHEVHSDARLLEAVPELQTEQLTARPSLYVPPSQPEHVVALDATSV